MVVTTCLADVKAVYMLQKWYVNGSTNGVLVGSDFSCFFFGSFCHCSCNCALY